MHSTNDNKLLVVDIYGYRQSNKRYVDISSFQIIAMRVEINIEMETTLMELSGRAMMDMLKICGP